MLKMINPKLSKMQVWFILFLGSYVTSILVPTAFAQAVDEDVVIYADGNLLTMNYCSWRHVDLFFFITSWFVSISI